MAASLTQGAILRMHNQNDTTAPIFIQVLDVKPIGGGGGGADRYRLVISDGQCFIQAMLATHLNHLVAPGQVRNARAVPPAAPNLNYSPEHGEGTEGASPVQGRGAAHARAARAARSGLSLAGPHVRLAPCPPRAP